MTETAGEPAVLVTPKDLIGRGRGRDEFGALEADQLKNIRKAAADWRTGLAGLVTLVTATIVFKGREKFDELSGWYKWAAFAAVIVALVAGIFALWRSLQAAHGEPKQLSREEFEDAGGAVGWRGNQAEDALRFFRQGRTAAVIAAIAIASALLLGLLSPEAPPAFAKVTYKTAAAAEPVMKCGEIDRSRNGYIHVKGEQRVINLRQVTTLLIVDSCGD